jgi:predicted Zn-ribbon and HTH transcriptional regulator
VNLSQRLLSALAPYRSRVVRRTCLFCGYVADVDSRLIRSRSPRGQERSFRPADLQSSGLAAFSGARMDMLRAEVQHRSRVANEQLEVLEGTRRCPKCGSKRLENARSKAPAARRVRKDDSLGS